MVFSSTIFVFGFLPITVIINYLLKEQYRNFWLLFASVLFYTWAQPQSLGLLACIVLVDYLSAIIVKHINRYGGAILGIVFNVAALCYFKYLNFIIKSAISLLNSDISLVEIILPIGISFYVFKGISYIVDVYRGIINADKSLLNVTLYLIMFPEIMSGPIDRFANIECSLKNREIDIDNIKIGICRFIQGLAKKVIIANTLGQMVDSIWSLGAGSISWKIAWLGSVAYSLQIYFDFSGYSDMAIGVGRMLGFKLAENFNLPYVSRSITEFWRRWHMTLGSWFKDYIYIPLGGNRKHVYLNIAIVFLLTGIWHGAAWTFVIWGAIHGFCRLLEKFMQQRDVSTGTPAVLTFIIEHTYLLFVVNIGWVFFRAPDVDTAVQFIKSMFGVLSANPAGISTRYFLDRWNVFVLVVAAFFSSSLPTAVAKAIKARVAERSWIILADSSLMAILFFSVLRIVTETYNTFIYFQF